MSDHEVLFFAIVLLYLSECLFWIDSRGIAFMKSYEKWRVAFPSAFFGTVRGGFALAWPFPYLGSVHLAYLLPISFSRDGIVNVTLERVGTRTTVAPVGQSTRVLYKNIDSVGHDGKNLMINGKVFCECASGRQADFLVRILQDITGGESGYWKIEKHIHALFDSSQLEKHEDDLLKHAKQLAVFCNIQWFALFAVCPFLVFSFGTYALIASVLYIILSNVAMVLLYYHVHRKVYTDTRTGCFADIAKMLLSPPLTIRAQDLLSLQYCIAYHPLTVAYHLLDRQDFMLFAKRMLLSYSHAHILFDGVDHKDDLLWHLKVLEKAAKEFLVKNNIPVLELLSPPSQVEGVASYCPRCHAQYVQKSGQCEDCNGIDLIEYAGIGHG